MIDINNLPDFLTIEEVAEILRLKRSTAYQYAHDGIIPATKIGHFLRVPKARILEMIGVPPGDHDGDGELIPMPPSG